MARGANGYDLTAGFKKVENGFLVTVGDKTYCVTKGSDVTLESILSPHLKGTVTNARVTKPRKNKGGRPKGSKNKPEQVELFQPPAAAPNSALPTLAEPAPVTKGKRRVKKFTVNAVEAPPAQG